MTRIAIAEWIVATCLLYGASESTAYLVAGHFLQGLERDASARAEAATQGGRDG